MKRRQTFSVLIWLSASRAKNPEGILYARVTVDGRRAEISLGKKVKPEQWDEYASKVLGRTPEAHQINSFIDLVKGKLNQHYIELVASNEAVTAELIKKKYLGITEKGKTFLEVFRYHNTQMESLIGKDIAVGTYKRYLVAIRKIENFLPHTYRKSDIYLHDLKWRIR